ncbi:DNA-binding ATP-dependent protease La [Escherichia coli]|nr:DNA-binding ATP-dependent protease La [Escherichia coli]
MNPERSERIEIPVLPLRDVVVYPHMVIPLLSGGKIYPLSGSGDGP